MKFISQIKKIAEKHIFTTVPKDQKHKFKTDLYHINMSRFASLSFLMIILNIFSLLLYTSLYNLNEDFHFLHIFAHITIIIAMIGFLFYYSKNSEKEYNKKNFIQKHISTIYPVVYSVFEFLLFISSPQDFGAFARFFMMPLIIGSISIMNQKKSSTLFAMSLLFQVLYISNFSKFSLENYSYSALVFNVLFVTLFSATLVSCFIYSSQVNNFKLKIKDEKIKDELMVLNKSLEMLSRYDQLTGLSNIRDLESFMENTWAKVVLENMNVSIALIDIDYFRRFNESFGRVKGDDCIKQVSNLIRDYISDDENYFLARYERQEFILVAYDKTYDEVIIRIEEIRKRVEALGIENPKSGISSFITVSAGIAFTKANDTVKRKDFIEHADKCVYYAKQNGRNKIIYSIFGNKIFQDVPGEITIDESKNQFMFNKSTYKNIVLNRAMKEIGADCTFVYYRRQNVIEFSDMAAETYDLPNSILNPTIDKVLAYFSLEFDDIEKISSLFKNAIEQRSKSIVLEPQLKLPNGKRATVMINIKCIYQGTLLEVATGSIVSIEEALQYNKYIQKEAMINSITLLPSRMKFYSDMKLILKRKDSKGFIVLIDIDNFKMINNMYSHNIGDKVLLEVGDLLKKLSERHGEIYNYAIDQFIIIVENCTEKRTTQLIEQIQEHFKRQVLPIDGSNIKINFSVGAVEYKENHVDLNELMVDLDITVQKVKFEDRYGYAFFEEKDKVAYLKRLNLEKELQDAVDEDFRGFILNYQPIICSETKECIGCEALLRWRNRDGKIIPPIEIIPILEFTGLMAKVEEWIFDEVCRQCREWIDAGTSEEFFIQVNLSTVQISRSSLIDEVKESIDRYNLSLKNILLEVTESSIMVEMKSTISTLDLLRQMGVKIAVDDFGTGYSSLSYLRFLPIDEIKIDKSFLDHIEHDSVARNFLSSIVDMSKSMGYLVCAEGVETKEQVKILSTLKIDYFQGFYFARPLEADVLYKDFIVPEINKLKNISKEA